MSSGLDNRERLFEALNNGMEPSIAEIKARLGLTSDRHVRRLIRSLKDDKVPIREFRTGRTKRFSIPEEERVVDGRPLRLTEDQAFALAVAAEASRATLAPTPLGEPLRLAVAELNALLSPNVQTFDVGNLREHWHFGSSATVSIDPQIFRAIIRAVEECRRIRIDYLTASTGKFSTDRLVEPLVVAAVGGTWLLTAYCHRRNDIVDFSLAGISRVVPCDPSVETAYFARPEFDAGIHFRDRFGVLSGAGEYVVRMSVDASKAVYFGRKQYHPTQQIETTREDGSIVVSYEVSGLDEIRSFIQGWGAAVTVLDPPELIERIRSEAHGVLALYEDRSQPILSSAQHTLDGFEDPIQSEGE